jgi:NTP pyrophosphatase (non-canonical NTP hydrolase)
MNHLNQIQASERGPSAGNEITAVVCGSFRRDQAALRKDFEALVAAGCNVISPLNVDFVAEVKGFAYSEHELQLAPTEVEERHLLAMQRAHMAWLHCPKGYVGRSAAMELGFARALGLRVFAAEAPDDEVIADAVELCASPGAAVTRVGKSLGDAPTQALFTLQGYYVRAAAARGWSHEGSAETIDLLRGEVEELEEALTAGTKREAELEMADVQLYLVHLANILDVDLGAAVRDKEQINSERFGAATDELAA